MIQSRQVKIQNANWANAIVLVALHLDCAKLRSSCWLCVDNQIDYNHLIEFRYSHCKVKYTQEQINLYKIMYKRAILLKILSFTILFEVARKIGGDI